MAAVLFDTQKFVKRLQEANFPPEQAEAQSEAMREVLETAFASQAKEQQEISTRAVEALDGETEKALIALKNEVNERFIKTDAKIDLLEQRMQSRFTLLQWMLTALIAGVAGLLVRAFST